MSSPVGVSFSQFIRIDRRKVDPVYLQIVYQVINAVQRGILEDGQKLPGSRILSKELGVHRKTIVAALEELRAQGWIESKLNVGTFVKNSFPVSKVGGNSHVFPQKAGFSFRKSFILDAPDQKNESPYRFTAGDLDYRIIKTNELARFYSVALRRRNLIKKLSGFPMHGNPFFKNQLSYYINQTRSFHIAPEHLLTAQSKEVILYILTQLLVEPQQVVLVGEWSYHFSNMVFRQAGANLKTIPMDEKGIRVSYIREHFKRGEIRAVYVHPQHQYPTTTSLSVARRTELIKLSEEYEFVIIEDDSDFELSYEKPTAWPLVKYSTLGKVIYLGCFGSFLTPGFQLHFMVAPKDIVEEAYKYLNIFGKMDVVKEQALGEIIREGDIHRYRRKALKVYQARRDLFAMLLEIHFANRLSFVVPHGGLAFWLQLNVLLSLNRWIKTCHKKGLFIPGNCLYQNRKMTALRLGFGHLNEEEMKEAVKLLKAGFEEENM